MGKMTRFEIENQVLRDKIRAAQYLLLDETREGHYKAPYTCGYLSVLDTTIKNAVEDGAYQPTKVFRIRYTDGTIGYVLYSKTETIEDAERKKKLYGGDYVIEVAE